MDLMGFGGLLGGAGKLFGGLFGSNKKTTENANYFTTDNSSTSGTRTPVLSQDWQNAFAAARGNLGGGGFTAGQQSANDFFANRMGPNSAVGAGLANANGLLGQGMTSLDNLQQGYNWMAAKPAYQLGAAPTSDYAGDVTARTGASFMDAYRNPFESQVVNATVNDYNANVDRTLTGLRQGRDAAGAFGDRAAIADGTFLGDANRGLLSTVAGLRSNNFQNSALLGQSDANRFLTADMGNQGARQQNNQFNSGLLDSRERANVGYRQDQDNNVFRSAEGIANTIAQKTGLGQQVLANIITADGINTDAAKSMFDMGQISQQQLNQILSLAGAGNGESITENRFGTSNRAGSGSGTSNSGFDPNMFGEGVGDIFKNWPR